MQRMVQDGASLSLFAAVRKAIWGGDIDHFPRMVQNGTEDVIETSDVIRRMLSSLSNVDPKPSDDKALDRIVKLTRESLDEVKALTEYQDGKATRLLTLLTFLSALAGVVFSRILESFPVRQMVARFDSMLWSDVFVWLAYISFSVFAALAACGTLVTFHAIRTRFKFEVKPGDDHPRSYLFYRQMIVGSPENWVESFTEVKNGGGFRIKDMYWDYVKNYILESYLVAAKAADKLRFLAAAQSLQALSIKALMLFFFAAALSAAFTKPVEQTNPIAPLAGVIQELARALSEQQSGRASTGPDPQSAESSEAKQDSDGH